MKEGKTVIKNSGMNAKITVFNDADSLPNKLGMTLSELIDKVETIKDLSMFRLEIGKDGIAEVHISKR